MTPRNYIVSALIKEVLGPRDGSNELLPLNQDPRDEYITGVLAPTSAGRPGDDIDGDVDDIGEEVTSEEDEDTTGYVVAPSGLSPALDPKALPRSVGLSFILETGNESPEIELCATWARYYQQQQGWQRAPSYQLTGRVLADRNQAWNDVTGISIQLRSQPLGNKRWRISVFLVNGTDVSGKARAETPDYLFQPQIRVHCCSGTQLVPVLEDNPREIVSLQSGSLAAEDASLSLLYRSRSAMARGHLCGTTWREIDPERVCEGILTPENAPYTWIDKTAIPDAERTKFTPADVRTDHVPCYASEAPDMAWDQRYGSAPELSPETLSETWSIEGIDRALRPVVDGYQHWIRNERGKAEALAGSQRSVAETHLEQCQQACNRIQNAIAILASDEQVRLAFCFANRAIHLQSQWAGRTIIWRPFQLAFILLNIGAISDPAHRDRQICDLLWFPTGGGKTESYLGLTAFTLALRRLRAKGSQHGHNSGAGVGVLSRYTLRLLTIQQFRRALGVITACELLRVHNLNEPGSLIGWRPSECKNRDNLLWGGIRFSVGLWVGGQVTSNNILGIGPVPSPDGFVYFPGAVDILQGGDSKDYDGPNDILLNKIRQSRRVLGGSEPAQILNCPACKSILAVPNASSDATRPQGLEPGQHTLHFVCEGGPLVVPPIAALQATGIPLTIDAINLSQHSAGAFFTLSVRFTVPNRKKLTARQIDLWWYQTIVPALAGQVTLMAARPARPGYFILTYSNTMRNSHQCDFDLYCPNPRCTLNQHAWAEQVPVPRTSTGLGVGQVSVGIGATALTAALPAMAGMQWQEVPLWCQTSRSVIADRIPIPALTVDDQVFHRCPSLVIATVDKFARLAFEPKASALFGNISHYHSRWGYYREGAPPSSGALPTTFRAHPPGYAAAKPLHVTVRPFIPPSLILQDELHLIEGPLGSMVGLYETAIDELCQYQQSGRSWGPKYIASTATVRQAESQVRSIFNRELSQFPPWGTEADERFFARDRETHPLQSINPGRLSIAICAPGKGAQTPIIRIWAALLQAAYEQWLLNPNDESDSFYTLVGYFNAIRELAGAVSLFRQDIPERLIFRNSAGGVRSLDNWLELSSRCNSMELPGLLESLGNQAPEAEDAVFATSMFGTGVDITRLGLMIVHGQPKTTASYIQATGRVGRLQGGLVVTFLRASRPRDLDHYEFFTGYQRAIYRHVEPITVSPFSPRARDRAIGPLAVALLRQAQSLRGRPVASEWRVQQRLSGGYYSEANRMVLHRHDSEVGILPDLFEERGQSQVEGRRPPVGVTSQEMDSELDLWKSVGAVNPNSSDFVYYETSTIRPPSRNVVLGDSHHRPQNLLEAFENAPQSLRDIEETTAFKV
jgi:Helicase conserved C-terminal domain